MTSTNQQIGAHFFMEEVCEGLKKWERKERKGRTWEDLQLGEDQKLTSSYSISETWFDEIKKKREKLENSKRGLIRSLFVIVDLSDRGLEQSFFGVAKIHVFKEKLIQFVSDYFDHNPMSQLSISTTCGSKCVIRSSFSCNPNDHIDAINNFSKITHDGDPSLQNSLESAISILKTTPEFATKEVLLVYGALLTCDSFPIDSLIKKLIESKITVSIIGFGAQVYVLNKIASETKGEYHIPISDEHLVEIMNSNLIPPPFSRENQNGVLIPFGFSISSSNEYASYDIYDLKTRFKDSQQKIGGYHCPKCNTRVFNVPSYCPVCQIMLIGPAHLTRTIHHLQPLSMFEESKTSDPCYGCHTVIHSHSYVCTKCDRHFCSKCNKYIHESLKNCPGCLSK